MSTPTPPMLATIENFKENIVPLRDGRRAAKLAKTLRQPPTRAELEAQRQRHESNVADQERHAPCAGAFHRDGLLDWLSYIEWIKQNFTGGQCQGELVPVLERCVSAFAQSPAYRDDARYLRVWLDYVDAVADPSDLFKFMGANGIGIRHAAYWKAHGQWLEKCEDWRGAEAVYEHGVAAGAEPAAAMRGAQMEFEARMFRRIKAQARATATWANWWEKLQQDWPTPPQDPGSRPHGLRDRAPATAPRPTFDVVCSARGGSAEPANAFAVLPDDVAPPPSRIPLASLGRSGAGAPSNPLAAAVWRDAPVASRGIKENVRPIAAWNDESIAEAAPRIPALHPIRPLQVFEDPAVVAPVPSLRRCTDDNRESSYEEARWAHMRMRGGRMATIGPGSGARSRDSPSSLVAATTSPRPLRDISSGFHRPPPNEVAAAEEYDEPTATGTLLTVHSRNALQTVYELFNRDPAGLVSHASVATPTRSLVPAASSSLARQPASISATTEAFVVLDQMAAGAFDASESPSFRASGGSPRPSGSTSVAHFRPPPCDKDLAPPMTFCLGLNPELTLKLAAGAASGPPNSSPLSASCTALVTALQTVAVRSTQPFRPASPRPAAIPYISDLIAPQGWSAGSAIASPDLCTAGLTVMRVLDADAAGDTRVAIATNAEDPTIGFVAVRVDRASRVAILANQGVPGFLPVDFLAGDARGPSWALSRFDPSRWALEFVRVAADDTSADHRVQGLAVTPATAIHFASAAFGALAALETVWCNGASTVGDLSMTAIDLPLLVSFPTAEAVAAPEDYLRLDRRAFSAYFCGFDVAAAGVSRAPATIEARRWDLYPRIAEHIRQWLGVAAAQSVALVEPVWKQLFAALAKCRDDPSTMRNLLEQHLVDKPHLVPPMINRLLLLKPSSGRSH